LGYKDYVYYFNNFRPHQGLDNLTLPVFASDKSKSNSNSNIDDFSISDVKRIKLLDGNLSYYYLKKTV
jgi:hypothetical protein